MSNPPLMKTLFVSLLCAISIGASAQTVSRHNVFFTANDPNLKPSSARVVESVYAKLPAGNQIKLGIEGPIARHHSTMDKNGITAGRAHSILKLLKRITKEDDQFVVIDANSNNSFMQPEMASKRKFELEILLTKAPAWIEPEFTAIDEFLPIPVQKFTINPKEDNRLVGEQGTVINIAANTLALTNGLVPDEMTVELKEVYGNGQIVQANLHTCSGGRMLNSGGTIHLNAHTNGKKAKVATGKELELEFPHGETVSENMEMFTGKTDRYGNFDWIPESRNRVKTEMRESFYINGKEVSAEEYYARIQAWENRKAEQQRQQEIAEQVAANEEGIDAYLLKSDQLGWINCDEFMDIENVTDVIVMVDTTLRPSVRMVFEDLNSVMNGYYNQLAGTVTFNDVPVGSEVRLVGYSIMEKQPYLANNRVLVSENLKQSLVLQKTTKPQMEAELAVLN